jgi:hypothetical protein
MKLRSFTVACVLSVATFLTPNAQAAMVTLSGRTVDYSFDSALLHALFGTFAVAAGSDTLQFLPLDWLSQADPNNRYGPLVQVPGATPLITITARAGYELVGLGLYERGVYSRTQFDEGNWTYAAANGQFIVNNTLHGVSADDVGEHNRFLDHIEIVNSTPPELNPWDIESDVVIGGLLATAQIQNLLRTGIRTGADGGAFIQTLAIELSAKTRALEATPVPLPAAAWLLGSSLIGLLALSRNRTRRGLPLPD